MMKIDDISLTISLSLCLSQTLSMMTMMEFLVFTLLNIRKIIMRLMRAAPHQTILRIFKTNIIKLDEKFDANEV